MDKNQSKKMWRQALGMGLAMSFTGNYMFNYKGNAIPTTPCKEPIPASTDTQNQLKVDAKAKRARKLARNLKVKG